MGEFGINGGVNGNTPLFKASATNNKNDIKGKSFDFGFNVGSEPITDSFKASNAPAVFNSYDLDQMWAMAGITKPESIKPLGDTIALAAEGAEYGIEYSDEDMNLARFMFENLKA